MRHNQGLAEAILLHIRRLSGLGVLRSGDRHRSYVEEFLNYTLGLRVADREEVLYLVFGERA